MRSERRGHLSPFPKPVISSFREIQKSILGNKRVCSRETVRLEQKIIMWEVNGFALLLAVVITSAILFTVTTFAFKRRKK